MALFLSELGSRRQLGSEFSSTQALENFNQLGECSLDRIEHPDTLGNYLERLPPEELEQLRFWMVSRLIRSRVFDRYRLFGALLVALDGSQLYTFSQRHCDHCLTRTSNEVTQYYHAVVEAKIVTPSGLAISLASEFIRNPEPNATKQDCEGIATRRLLERLRENFPQLHVCLLMDGLYANAPVLERCQDKQVDFIITFKSGSMPDRYREYEDLRALSPENRHRHQLEDGTLQDFAWVDDLPIGIHHVRVVECRETLRNGETRFFAWITNLLIGKRTVAALVNRGARLRWKIENEGFNAQKTRGYSLEHAYSRDEQAGMNFYLLMQLAHMINQLVVSGNLLPEICHAYGSFAGLARRLLESLRGFVLPTLRDQLAEAARVRIHLATG